MEARSGFISGRPARAKGLRIFMPEKEKKALLWMAESYGVSSKSMLSLMISWAFYTHKADRYVVQVLRKAHRKDYQNWLPTMTCQKDRQGWPEGVANRLAATWQRAFPIYERYYGQEKWYNPAPPPGWTPVNITVMGILYGWVDHQRDLSRFTPDYADGSAHVVGFGAGLGKTGGIEKSRLPAVGFGLEEGETIPLPAGLEEDEEEVSV